MPEVIVCNSSCLIALESIRRLDILNRLYDKVYITEFVAYEFRSELPHWLKVETVINRQAVQMLLLDIGGGEAEAIVLALEKGESTLILDDKKARRIAANLEIKLRKRVL